MRSFMLAVCDGRGMWRSWERSEMRAGLWWETSERKKELGRLKNKIQLDPAYYFIMLILGSKCFEHHYAHHQELTTTAFGYHIGRLVLELLLVGS